MLVIDNFSNSIYSIIKPSSEKILFNIFHLFSYLKTSFASLVLWDILYTIQLSRHESIRVQNSTVEVSKYSHVITSRPYSNCFHPKIGRVKINAPETLCAKKWRENSDSPREHRKEKRTKEDEKQISNVNTNCPV